MIQTMLGGGDAAEPAAEPAPAPGAPIGTWQYADKKLVCGPEGGSCNFKVPDDYLLQCTVQLDPKASLTLTMSNGFVTLR